MENLTFILWVLLASGWFQFGSFPDLDLCYATSERGAEPTMCLLPGDAPWHYVNPAIPAFFRPPRLEEMI